MLLFHKRRKYSPFLKIISIVVLSHLLINDISFALAPAPGTHEPIVRCEFRALSWVESGRLRFADTEPDRKLLESLNNAEALLVFPGNILASSRLKKDPKKLIRRIIYEEVKAILAIMAKEDSQKYASIVRMVLSQRAILEKYHLINPQYRDYDMPKEAIADDIVARAFELLVPRSNLLINDEDISPEELDFLNAVKPFIDSNRGKYFTGAFWDDVVREANIRVYMADHKELGQRPVLDGSRVELADTGKLTSETITEEERVRRDSLVNLITFFDSARGSQHEAEKAIAIYNLAMSFADAGLKEGAVLLLEKALDAARDIENETKQSNTLNNIIDSLTRLALIKKDKSLLEEALEIARGFEDESVGSPALAKVAYSFAEMGDIKNARAVIAEARDMTADIKDEPSKNKALSKVALSLCRIGAVGKEPLLIEEGLAIVKGFTDKSLKAHLLSEIASSFNNLGLKDRARELIKEALSLAGELVIVKDGVSKNTTLWDVVSDLARMSAKIKDRDGIKQALGIAKGAEDDYFKIKLILTIARFLDKEDMSTESKEAVRDAFALAKAVSDTDVREECLALVAPSLVWMGIRHKDDELTEKGFHVAHSIKSEDRKTMALSHIASSMAELGALENRIDHIFEARGIARGIIDPSWKPHCLSVVASCMTQIGAINKNDELIKQALDIADRITDAHLREETFSNIAVLLAEIGEKGKDGHLMEESIGIARKFLGDRRRIKTFTKMAPFLIRGGVVAESVRRNEGGIIDSVKKNLAKNGTLEEYDRHLLASIGLFSDTETVNLYLSDDKIPSLMKAYLVWGENFITGPQRENAKYLKELYDKEKTAPDSKGRDSLNAQDAIIRVLNFLVSEYKDMESFIYLEDIGAEPDIGYNGCKPGSVGIMPIGNLTLGFMPHMNIEMIFESRLSRHFGAGSVLRISADIVNKIDKNIIKHLKKRGNLGLVFLTRNNYGRDLFAHCYHNKLSEVVIVAPKNKKLMPMAEEIFDLVYALYHAKRSPLFSAEDLTAVDLRDTLRGDRNEYKAVLRMLSLNQKTVKIISVDDLIKALNDLLTMKDFHRNIGSETYYKHLDDEVQRTLSRARHDDPALTDLDYMRLNRALLEAMYPLEIQSRGRYLGSARDVERNLPIFIFSSNGIFYDDIMERFDKRFKGTMNREVFNEVRSHIVRGPTIHNGKRKGRDKQGTYEPGLEGGITIATENADILSRIKRIFKGQKYDVDKAKKFTSKNEHPLKTEFSKGVLNLYFNATGLLFIVDENRRIRRSTMGEVLNNDNVKKRAQEILKVAVALGLKDGMYDQSKSFEETVAAIQKGLDDVAATRLGHVTSSVSEIVSAEEIPGTDKVKLVVSYNPAVLKDGVTDLEGNLIEYLIRLAVKHGMDKELQFLKDLKKELAAKIVEAKEAYESNEADLVAANGQGSDGDQTPSRAVSAGKFEAVLPKETSDEWRGWLGSLDAFGRTDMSGIAESSAALESKIIEHDAKDQSIILYADDILENAAVYDLGYVVKNIIQKHNLLNGGKIVLFARSPVNAKILEKMIRSAAPDIDIASITEADIGQPIDGVKGLEAVARFARAKGVKDVLAIIKGYSNKENEQELCETARSLHAPIVLIGPEKALYSFSQALSMALAAKSSNGASFGWLIMLPPVRSVTEDIKAVYEAYSRALAILQAA